MNKLRNLLAAVGVIVLLLAVFKITQVHYQDKLETAREETRVERIKASNLEKVADGHHRKLVADTLKINELQELVDSLGIAAENPRIVEKVVLEFVEVEKEVDGVYVDNRNIVIEDSYPSKDNPFVKYDFRLDLLTNQSEGRFSLSKIPINLVISEKDDGTFNTDIQAPDFIEISSLDIQTLPLKQVKPDNFGWLAGVGYFKDVTRQEQGIEFTGGLRYRKIYLLGSAQTNSTIGGKILMEF